MNIILGSGMDSRLFTEVREKRGLAYSVGSSMSQWEYGSLNLINASTRSSNVDDMLEVISNEIEKIKSGDLTEEEIQRAKNKMRSGFYHAGESSYAASHRSIRTALFGDSSFDELESRMNEVSVDDVLEAANIIFDNSKRVVMVCDGE
jgi:predicted Zn-dependent peptidase